MPSHDQPATNLPELRREIDRIDEAMHRLLMERGEIIDRLIATKQTSETGSAFRPEREASMMRALAGRHRGLLPLETAEGIWRVIIATFTFVQAPFSVHGDASGGDSAMRDSARFHFGFTAPYLPRADAGDVIAGVAASRGDLGLLRIDQGATAGIWWRQLEGDGTPKVIARLPFIERPGHPAGTPVLVVSKPLGSPGARDVVLYSARLERWSNEAAGALGALGGEVLTSAGDGRGLAVLLSAPERAGPDAVAQALAAAGLARRSLAEVGSHAERFRV